MNPANNLKCRKPDVDGVEAVETCTDGNEPPLLTAEEAVAKIVKHYGKSLAVLAD